MQRSAIAAIIVSLALGGEAFAMPPSLTPAQLLDICASATVSEATSKADALGWQRMDDDQTEEWRTHFQAYNGGTVEAVGWRRGEREGDGLLSFWDARGPNGHRACSYSSAEPAGFWDALTQRFGTPGDVLKMEASQTAYWKSGLAEISFSQVGSTISITIAYKN